MPKDANIDLRTYLELDWEYVTAMSKKKGELLWPKLQFFMQNGELCFLCCFPFELEGAWILSTLPTHVPSIMLNHFNGGKEEMFKM